MVVLTQHSPPSYKQGYARNATDSVAPNLWRGLAGAWVPSLGPTGLTLFDASGNKNNGTLTTMDPATDWVISGDRTHSGYALDFDGVDDNVNIGNVDALDITNELTLAIWIRPPDTDGYVIAKTDYSSSGGYSLYFNGSGNRVQIYYGSSSVKNSSTVFTDIDVWVHAVITVTSSETAFFRNGEPAGTASGFTLSSGTQPVRLGIRSDLAAGNRYAGLMDHVYIYDRVLAPNEIKQLYVDRLAPFRQRQRFVFPESEVAAGGGRIMSSLVGAGGLAGSGGIAGQGGGLVA